MSEPAALVGLPALAKYDLLEEIGHGGMATVYRARDPRLGRDVAIKLIHKHLRENMEVATRFVAEARAAAKLRHPGIVEVYDVSAEDDNERYLVVELIGGTTLRKVLQRHRDMPAEVGAAIVLCLCEALEHAHTAGIIHRDVKPENVLVELPSDRALRLCSPAPPAMADVSSVETSSPVHASHDPFSASARGERSERDPKPSDSGRESVLDARAGSTPLTLSGVVQAATGSMDSSLQGSAGRAEKVPATDAARSSTSSAPPARASGRGSRPTPSSPDAAGGQQAPALGQAKRGAKRTDGEVVIKLTDFGIAKVLDAQGVTSTGQVLGSPAHMAPEQIEGGEVDARMDVFALGVLMYECLVGHLPFEGKNPAQVLRKVLECTYPPADRERPTVGGRWSRIVAVALAREIEDRTPSPAALGEQIEAELKAVGITNPRAEIAAYFQDPEGYSAELTRKLVPRLVARGESARKAGDVPGAAADYNRALALAPSDLTILKRLASLTSSTKRRLLLRRALLVAGALGVSGVLGLSAYGAARYFKAVPSSADARPRSLATAFIAPIVPSALRPWPTASAEEPVRAMPSADPFAPRPRASSLPWSGAPPSLRKVRFAILPNGAKLTLNGQPVNWFGTIFSLPPGPQSVRVALPGSKCCEPEVGTRAVNPASPSNPDEVQTIVIKLKLLPASVTVSGPPSGQYVCPEIGLSGLAGTTRQIALPEAVWQGRCEFRQPSVGARVGRANVTLKAGEPNTIGWVN